jgi:hypothetical protein
LKDFARRNRFLILMRKNTEDLRLKGSEHRSSGHRCEAIYERLRNHLRLYCLLALESDDEIGKAAVAATSFQGGNWKGQLRRWNSPSVEICRETDGPLTRGREVGQLPPSCRVFV